MDFAFFIVICSKLPGDREIFNGERKKAGIGVPSPDSRFFVKDD